MQPREIGPFALLEELAKGGMGEVWLARHFGLPTLAGSPQIPDLCVVKLVRADRGDDDDARARFVDEMRIALLLAHPGIVRTVDAGTVSDMDYLALEVVDGISLTPLLERMAAAHEPFDDSVALYIGACVADALAFAHDARHPTHGTALGVVHRDISPHNVMVTGTGEVKVIDFGVALSALKQTRTAHGIVVGKMTYMSPEQARGDAADARADIFAVAVVVYELVAGQRYYGNMTLNEVWGVAGTGEYLAPRRHLLAPDIWAVLERALHPDAEHRTQTAAELRAGFVALLHNRLGATRSASLLAATVSRYAEQELARVERVRIAARGASAPKDTTTTRSIAVQEAAAVSAALRARSNEPATKTLLMLEAVIPAPASAPQRAITVVDAATPIAVPAAPSQVALTRHRPALLAAAAACVVIAAFALTRAPSTPRTDAGEVAVVSTRVDAGAVAGGAVVDAGGTPSQLQPRDTTLDVVEVVDAGSATKTPRATNPVDVAICSTAQRVRACACGKVYRAPRLCEQVGTMSKQDKAQLLASLQNCQRTCQP